jgi:Fe-S oxidoreductase
MDVATPFVEVANAIVEAGGKDLNLCYQCATCTGSCPWGYVDPLNIRQLIHLAQLGLEGYESEDLWKCTTCGTCKARCPRGVGIIDLVRSIRMMIGETGLIPLTLRSALGSVRGDGNPWSCSRAERNRWAAPLAIPQFDRTRHEYLLYACCMASCDVRSRKIVEAATRVLRAAGVSFGVIGAEEECCGESVRKIGEESLFESLAQRNCELFRSRGVEKIIVVSPHCYDAIKNDYPAFGPRFQVTHIVEKVAALLLLGKLAPTRPLQRRITYHDPCYLGRHNNVFDPPRMILQALPGVELCEMYRARELSLCCGGGGGRMWMETKLGQRFSDLRIPEALAVGANVLATACPYCVSMLEDSRLNLNREDAIEVKDLTELVAETLV